MQKNIKQEYLQVMLENVKNNNAIWSSGVDSTHFPVVNINANDHQLGNLNSSILLNQARVKGFESSRWLMRNEIKKLGIYIKKGEKSTYIKNKQGVSVVMFNVDQLNIPADHYLKTKPIEVRKNKILEEIILSSAIPVVTTDSNVASYNANKKVIEMPARERFESVASYYTTIIHELAHATYCANRNILSTDVNDSKYAEQELTAEMTAYFLCREAGIDFNCLTN